MTQRIARLYVPRRSLQRAAITRLLFIAAEAPDRDLAKFRLLNAAPIAYFVNAPVLVGEARNALRDQALLTMRRGAELVARKGAGRDCLRCSTRLRKRAGRRRFYCESCTQSDLHELEKVREVEAVRTVLDRAARVLVGE